MEAENTLLKEEIRRLQYLNRVLTDRLMAVEGAIPHSQNLQRSEEAALPHSQNLQGGTETALPHSENKQWGTEDPLPHSENFQGGTEPSVPRSQNLRGSIKPSVPHSENMQGGIALFRLNASYDHSDGFVTSYIRQQLRTEAMKGVRRKTIPHVAAALLHVARGGQLDYHHVRSHYGYSERGSSKFITMLLRRSLLERRGGRAVFLTVAGRRHFPEGYFLP